MADKANILIVDDELGPRESLKMVLKPFYTVYTAENGEKALDVLEKHPIDLVTLDLKMPGLSGTETLRELKRIKQDLQVIIITGFGSLKTAMEGIRYGAADYILKPFDIAELVSIVNRTLERKKINDRIKGFIKELGRLINVQSDLVNFKMRLGEGLDLTEKIKEILQHSLFDEALQPEQRTLVFAKSLAEIIEGHSSHPNYHSKRVAYYCNLIGQQLKLSPQQLADLDLGAYLHDIGSLELYQKLFHKEGHSDQNGGERPRGHAEIGSELITPLGISPLVIQIVRHHHEHYDGSGSPEGLNGEEIPLLARIVAVAEAFDEMLTNSVGHEALSLGETVAEFKQGSGIRFDPKLVSTFLQIINEKKESLLPEFIGSRVVI
ncbi:MAG: HD domain-containing phosphohydrolase [Nitrospiria bacterium]